MADEKVTLEIDRDVWVRTRATLSAGMLPRGAAEKALREIGEAAARAPLVDVAPPATANEDALWVRRLRADLDAAIDVIPVYARDVRAALATLAALRSELDAAWQATGVAGAVRGMTTLDDVVRVNEESRKEVRALASRLIAARRERLVLDAAEADAAEALREAIGEAPR